MPASSLLLLALIQATDGGQRPADVTCESSRIELGRAPSLSPRDVCVSPGLVTSFLFDVPIAFVDLQGEVHFVEVVRGQRMLSVMPPQDMQPGERLRLTMGLEGGDAQRVTFMLVAHRGQATHQVQVFHDPRPVESLRQECEQERAKNQRLLQENERLRVRIRRTRGLSLLLSTNTTGLNEPLIRSLNLRASSESDGELSFNRVLTYRTVDSIAVKLWLRNQGSTPWSVTGASLVDSRGEELRGLQWFQNKNMAPDDSASVVVEADAAQSDTLGPMTLTLWDEHSRSITFSQVAFP